MTMSILKTWLVTLLALFMITPARGAGPDLGKITVTQVRTVYATTNVTTAAWVQLVASLGRYVTEISVFDSSGQTLKLGVGAPGSEVTQLIITPGGNGTVPLNIPKGSRVSIRAISATANAGESDINFYE